jgi:predicted SnoaL-like aldol condensation-catalyzing enzyme
MLREAAATVLVVLTPAGMSRTANFENKQAKNGETTMRNTMKPLAAAAGFVAALCISQTAQAGSTENKAIVRKAVTELIINRDATTIDRYWSKTYVQHNPLGVNGSASLPGLVKSLPAGLKYEFGETVADGDLVMIHGRYTGLGPKPFVAVDIFRLQDGKIVEHWDVLQEEVPASQTKSGNPMFTASSD